MKELFASQLKHTSSAGRRKLARILLDEARNEKGSPADQFVLLAGAIECAEDANSLDLCFESADAMGAAFDVDVLAAKLASALKVLPKPSARSVAEEAVGRSFGLLDQFIAADDLPAAGKLVAAMRGPAGTDAELRKSLQEKTQELQSLESNRERYVAALNQLKRAPDDAAANLAVGQYFCFDKGQWEKGLPLLARGNDSKLKALALEESGFSRATAEARAKVADEWWMLSASLPDAAKAQVLKHAADIYGQAMPRLENLRRKLAEERIAEASAIVAGIVSSPIRKTYQFDDATALDEFEVDGNARVTSTHELDLSHGMPSAVMSKQKFRYPIRAVFEVYCKSDGVMDIFPSILAERENNGFGLVLGGDHNHQSWLGVFGSFSKLSLEPVQPDHVYRIVLSVDKARNATVELDGKEIYRGPIPAGAGPEGVVILSGGRGHVVYRRCTLTAFPSAKN